MLLYGQRNQKSFKTGILLLTLMSLRNAYYPFDQNPPLPSNYDICLSYHLPPPPSSLLPPPSSLLLPHPVSNQILQTQQRKVLH